MLHAGRLKWRLFYLALGCALAASQAAGQSPALTTVSDTVFRADGNPASGTLLISWPAFTTADGHTVAAGNKSVALGFNGSFAVQLAPNAGATPSGTTYLVTYQLSDATVKTENWSVGATSPETISQVRTLVGTSAPLTQVATQQYVNSALASVVHLSGSETITGPKQFSVAPVLPAPSQSGQAANKAYVDASVAGSSSGGSGLTPGMLAIKYASDFAWTQSPTSDLTAPGVKTVTLTACPPGVSGGEPQFFVYLSGTGTAEAVVVTGGSCSGNGLSGTLQFTTANAHAAGYTVGSASGGLQEALVAARFTPSNPTGSSQSGKVIVPPGELKAFARVSIRASNITVDFSGSVVECWMNDTCIFVGDPANSSLFEDVTLVNPRGRPTVAGGQKPFLEVNAQKTRIFNVATRLPFSGGTFGTFVQVDDDQAFLLDGLDSVLGGGLRCDSTVCDPAVYAPGPFNTFSAVGWLKHLNISLEMGGATVLQHGDVVFNAASTGILGGLYLGVVSQANCVAGFRITPASAVSQVQAVVDGIAVGAAMTTVAGHHYGLTTRIYSQEIYRLQQTFHGAANPAGSGLGGEQVSANVRLVLEVHDVDPTNPATMIAASTVLYDGVLSGAPAFCSYALVNSPGLHCSIGFTRFIEAADAEVRSALPGQSYRTRLVGPLSSGGECNVYSGPTLDFFSLYVPALNELLEVHYRGSTRAMARVTNPVSIAQQQSGNDDGVRSLVHHMKSPPARTSADCENGALALVTDGASAGWIGKYQTWSDFLPGGATDIFPGDALNVNVPSREAVFQAVVSQVQIRCEDLLGEHSVYEIQFAAGVTNKFAFELDSVALTNFLTAAALNVVSPIINSQVGATVLPDLTAAAVTLVSSTTASLDAGIAPPTGGGIECRWSDLGWGPANDQNLAGRFTTQTFTLPRLAKVQDYFLRQFDASVPRKYSRCSSALHIDYPY